MEEKKTHKKHLLHPSQPENVAEIEKQVDELFIARTGSSEKKTSPDHPAKEWSFPQDTKKSNLFYVESKKKPEQAKTNMTSKKTTTLKAKNISVLTKRKRNRLLKKQNPFP